MKQLLIFFGIVLLASCDVPPGPGMREEKPVVVQQPDTLKALQGGVVIDISGSSIRLEKKDDTTILSTWNQLDSVLKEIPKQQLRSPVTLAANDRKDYKRIDTAVAMLKRNGIEQFNLVTDLEK